MITQKEIAERLGISRTTVARAINGSSSIKEETKQRILELVKEMNYEKNIIGSSLAGRKNKKVYCLVIESKNEFYTQEIIRGLQLAEKEYKSYGYKLDIITTNINEPEEQIKTLESVIKSEDIDGLIITPLDKIKAYEILLPYKDKFNIISLGIRLGEEFFHVGPDHFKQGRISGRIFSTILREREKLLIINNGDDKISSREYLEGFLSVIKESNISIVGPFDASGIEYSVQLIKALYKNEKFNGIYINRFAQDIYEKLPKDILANTKIVTNGISKNIKKMIKKGIITATVMEEISAEGYISGKKMFEFLYKGKLEKKNWEISKSHILFLENIDD